MIKRILVLSVFSVFSLPVLAGWTSTYGIVTDVYSHNGTVLIGTEITDGPCASKGGFWWPITDDDSDIMLSLVLSAQASGKKIRVVYSDADAECMYGRAKITHIHLTNS